MEIILKKNRKVSFLILCFLMFCSCGNNIDFIAFKSVDKGVWKSNEKINFKFSIEDTISPKNLFINIRNNQDYGYSNLYVITSLKFPNGTKIVDTLQYEMANEKGEFLGTGFSNIKESKLFYKENKVFPNSGEYEFSIHHAMRKQGEVHPIAELKGIQDIGLSIEKITE